MDHCAPWCNSRLTAASNLCLTSGAAEEPGADRFVLHYRNLKNLFLALYAIIQSFKSLSFISTIIIVPVSAHLVWLYIWPTQPISSSVFNKTLTTTAGIQEGKLNFLRGLRLLGDFFLEMKNLSLLSAYATGNIAISPFKFVVVQLAKAFRSKVLLKIAIKSKLVLANL